METAPQENTIGGGYKTPPVQKPLPRDYWLQVLDVVLLAAAMGVSVWLVLTRRSRKWLLALSIGSLAYFGFYREGCICPIGSIQNVAVALTDPKYSIPMVVTATFFLPLVVALFFGRAFCGGVRGLVLRRHHRPMWAWSTQGKGAAIAGQPLIARPRPPYGQSCDCDFRRFCAPPTPRVRVLAQSENPERKLNEMSRC